MDFFFSQEGRNKIKQGIDTTANAIKVTLGDKIKLLYRLIVL